MICRPLCLRRQVLPNLNLQLRLNFCLCHVTKIIHKRRLQNQYADVMSDDIKPSFPSYCLQSYVPPKAHRNRRNLWGYKCMGPVSPLFAEGYGSPLFCPKVIFSSLNVRTRRYEASALCFQSH